MSAGNIPLANTTGTLGLFYVTPCELDSDRAVGFASDETAGAWLCRSHLKRFQIQSLSVGRTLAHYLREPKS